MKEWIEANVDRLYGYACSLAQDSDEARDLVQECILRAMQSPHRPDDHSSLRAWMFRILRNAFIDRRRKLGREVLVEAGDDLPAEGNDRWSGDRRLVDIITIRIALARLPLAQRDIIVLVDFVGCSYAEVARVLDIPIGTVMSRLSRARHALLRLIEEGNVTPISLGAASRGAAR